ncbi:MAG: hypothetical protein HOW73_23985 [Polyangiaceae bacterium]|nr:hypothetical protein [Polyangiaceae bacterium]
MANELEEALRGLPTETKRKLRALFRDITRPFRWLGESSDLDERIDAIVWHVIEELASAAQMTLDRALARSRPSKHLDQLHELFERLRATDPPSPLAILREIAELLGFDISPSPSGGGTNPNPPTPGPPGGPSGPGGTPIPPNPNPPMEAPVAAKFIFEKRGIPNDLATTEALQKTYIDTVQQLIQLRGSDATNGVLVAAVIGGLLRSSQFSPSSSSFALFARRILDELLVSRGVGGQPLTVVTPGAFTSLQVHQKIAEYLAQRGGSGSSISYQLFSFVGEETMRTISNVPMGDPSFTARIDRAVLDYASGATGFESLELPALESSIDTEIVPENIQAVGMLYAAQELDKAKLLTAVDIIADLYDDGLIPISFDDAGQALDTYRFSVDQRVPEAKRASYFSRVFGTRGGDVAKSVQPNAQFDTLLMRFMSSVAEYERERDVAQIFERSAESNGRVGLITGEQVRKAGRELAANLSLYGWGAAHTIARRLNTHIRTALQILAMPQVQQAFGATNEWQVVERVCQQELKHIPNILKHKTMAESGKMVLDIVAKHAAVWRRSGSDVFYELGPDAEALRNHARYWLTVNGITDSTLDKMSQPVEAAVLPTVPAFSGTQIHGLNGQGSNGVNEQALAQLRNLVAAGQTPSPEQLQRLLSN